MGVQNTCGVFSLLEHAGWQSTLLCSLTTFQICSSSLMMGCNKNTSFHYLTLCMSLPIANFCMKRHSSYYSKSEVGTCINWICKQEPFTGFFAFRFYLMRRNKHIFKVTLRLLPEGHDMMVQLTMERHEVNTDSQWVPRSGTVLISSLKSSDPNGSLVSAKPMYLSMLHQLFEERAKQTSSSGKMVQALLSRAQALEHAPQPPITLKFSNLIQLLSLDQKWFLAAEFY